MKYGLFIKCHEYSFHKIKLSINPLSHGVKNAAFFSLIKHRSLWEDYLVVCRQNCLRLRVYYNKTVWECMERSIVSQFTGFEEWNSTYDMIWLYLHKIAAQRPNYNVQYKTRRKKKHDMTKNKAKSTTIDNRETRPNCEAGKQRRKKKARNPIMGICCWSNPHNMGLDYKHIY